MSITAVVGCQWGDEGKGKIVDRLAQQADWVARFQGGANAGHTVFVGEKPAILHLVPSGILRPDVKCAIGNGVVLDPLALLSELKELEDLGIAWQGRLFISALAHIVTPLHTALEAHRQQDSAIGTTKRGIGPTYESKASRRGLRVEDFLNEGRFRERLQELWDDCDLIMGGTLADATGLADCAALAAHLAAARRLIAPLVCDVSDLLLNADDAGERVLCEGAQGALLDIDHGTYPFVTSSNTTIGGVCTGLGLPPQRISKVYGIIKAYTTRVGHGPFPTEFHGAEAERFRQKAGEYGATTGRPRRCGWFDGVLARRCVRINGVDELIVTKLDVLGDMDPLRMAIAYAEGTATWSSGWILGQATAEYKDMPGWGSDLSAIRDLKGLPAEAQSYLEAIEELAGAPVGLVSVGPGRDQVVATKP